MMTATQRQQLQERRNAAFWLCMFALAVATAAFFIVVPRFIPVTTPDPLPFPVWSDDEPEEDPCVSPAQRLYLEHWEKIKQRDDSNP